jgi:tRNA pseudouridine38-40 synthase
MYYHRLLISYKGTNYFGWQDLGVGQQKPTVQASIQQVLNKICKYQSCIISVASRTDAGVHAQGQVIKITIPLAIQSSKLQLGMNSLLPDDIRILECNPCSAEFNSNKDSKSKEYHYYFCTDTIFNPLLNDIVTHIPSNNGLLDIQLMQEACNLFIGKHDFYSFSKRDTTMNSTFRTILNCEIVQVQPSTFSNKTYYLKILGNGFLRHMVRYIAGALFAIGRKEVSLSDISELLMNPKDEKITSKAKSRGLHLIKIYY